MMTREEEMKGKGQKNLDSIFRSQSLCCEVRKSHHVRDTFCFNEHREIAIYFFKKCNGDNAGQDRRGDELREEGEDRSEHDSR